MNRTLHVATILAASTATASADTTINFFGDVIYKVEHTSIAEPGPGAAPAEPPESDSDTFQAATLDIFASQTEGKWTFVGEAVVEAFGSNDFVIDADRLEVMYQAKPWLRIRAGRMRSAWGYYSDAYQNGKFFMVPVAWPDMYEGDATDGIVPSHVVGLQVSASKQLGESAGKLTLDAEVLNGRGIDAGEVSAFHDANEGKAVNLRLRYVGQEDLEGLIVGGNVYIDDIPEDTTPGVEHGNMHELALGAHAAYNGHDVHAIAEGAWFRHRDFGMDTIHTTFAAFGEFGYTFDDITPFGRYQYFKFGDEPDPYFATGGLDVSDRHVLSAGVKYVASASVSLKLQADSELTEAYTHYHLIAQAAFAF